MAATPEQTQTIANYYRFILQREPDDAGLANWSAVVPQFFSIDDVRAAFVASAEAQNNVSPVVRLYQTSFNRVPDQSGLEDWAGVLGTGTSLRDVAGAFANSAEFQASFPGTDINEALVRALYRSALDRTPESPEVVQTWVNSGLSRGDLLLAFANSPESLSRTASPVTTFLDRAGQGDAAIYTGNLYDAVHAPGGASGGQTLTLTTGVDNITGTSGNDIIIADNTGSSAQLGAADQINGAAGTDALKIYQAAATGLENTSFGTLSNVEAIYINSGVLTNTKALNVSGLSGVTSIALDSPAAMADGDIFTIKTSATQALSLTNVVGVAGAATSTVKLDGPASATLSGVSTDITLDLASTGTALTLTTTGAASDLTGITNSGAKLATLTLAGDKALTVGAGLDFANSAGTITATGMSADLTIGATNNDAITFTGGSGKNSIITGSGNDSLTGGASDDSLNAGTGKDTVSGGGGTDTITIGAGTVSVDAGAGNDTVQVAGLDSTDSFKGGDGTDVLALVFADADAADDATTAAANLRSTFSGFEQVRVTDAITADLNIGRLGFNYLQAGADVTTAATVSGFTSSATVEFRNAGDQTAALTVGINDAATSTSDVLNTFLNADLVDTAAHQVKIGVPSINTVVVNAVDRVDDPAAATDNGADDGYVLALSNSANLTKLAINGTAAVNYTSDAVATALQEIDASASTGNITVDVSAFVGTERITVKGSQGINNITGSDTTFGDAIIGGSKGDLIYGGVGPDAITGNGGRDAFGVDDGDSSATSMDTISDFGKITTAATSSEVSTMTNATAFQATGTTTGGENADLLIIGDQEAVLGGAQAATDVKAAIAGGVGTETVTATESAKGILTLSGADAGQIDTLSEWIAVAGIMAVADADVVGFQFNGNTYVLQKELDVGPDNVVQMTGVTGVTGIVTIGESISAAAGDIFVW